MVSNPDGNSQELPVVHSSLKAVSEVEVPVVVRLAGTTLTLDEILRLRPGSTLRFTQSVDDPVTLEVDGVSVGSGTVVEQDGRLGVRLESPGRVRR